MKLTCWASLTNKEQVPFSMRSIKTYFYNKFLTETIFSNLGIDLNCNKIKKLYSQCLNYWLYGCLKYYPTIDEEDLEENNLTVEEADQIVWDPPKDGSSGSEEKDITD